MARITVTAIMFPLAIGSVNKLIWLCPYIDWFFFQISVEFQMLLCSKIIKIKQSMDGTGVALFTNLGEILKKGKIFNFETISQEVLEKLWNWNLGIKLLIYI